MSMRARWRWLVAVTRWAALRLAGVIRLLAIVAIAVGLGLGVADYSNGEFMVQLALYGLLPAAVAMIVAERLTRIGKYVGDGDTLAEATPPADEARRDR
jgi:hypothetical protein